jgi:PAS domain S-box-containing protein
VGGVESDAVQALANAGALGLPALAAVLAGTQEGVTVVDSERRWVYANPAACRTLGRPLEELRGRDFLSAVPAPDRALHLDRFREQLNGVAGEFASTMLTVDGAEREIVSSTFVIEMDGRPHGVAIFRDITGPRAAGRTAAALAQTAADLTGDSTPNELLAGISRHAVESTRAMACGISTLDDELRFAEAGGYGPIFGQPPDPGETMSPGWLALSAARGEVVIDAMTAGGVIIGEPPGDPVVLSDARSMWEANTAVRAYAMTLVGMDWQAVACVPMSWQNRVFGMLAVFLPVGLAGPDEAELAFYMALADQAAVAVINARLSEQAGEAAASLERSRLARNLHDSVSQALFSMTMHARAAQLSLAPAGLDASSPLGRSVSELAQLSRGAMAEMRALIFELRPGALAEEGLVRALGKQAAALSAREEVAITVEGPDGRLNLDAATEEHLYRIVSEALHNIVKHAHADHATVTLTTDTGVLQVEVSDDGAGFDRALAHPGHLGLSTMSDRAGLIGAELVVTSAPGAGTTVALSRPNGEVGRDDD